MKRPSDCEERLRAAHHDEQTVLVAEDCDENAYIITKLIREISDRIQVRRAVNGHEALDQVRSGAIDLALLDLRMPQLDGYEVLRRLKETGIGSGTPVMVISGVDTIDSALECIENGAEDYLVKPFDPVLLKARICAQLERQSLRKKEARYLAEIREANERLEKRVTEQVEEIRARFEAQKRLEWERDRIEQRDQMKSKFISLLSHDLRSPLSAVYSAMRTLGQMENPGEGDAGRRLVSGSMATTESLLQMIDNLLDIDRLQTGRFQLFPTTFSLKELGTGVFAYIGALAADKGIRLVNDVPPGVTVIGDLQMITQVVQNLVGNAIKFCKEGDEIRLWIDDAGALVVSDTGPGIAPGMIPYLFDSNQKTSLLGTRGERGNGLGLPLAREIMETHDGDLRVVSELGKGSSFFLDFSPKRLKALVIDDDDVHRMFLHSVLKEAFPHVELLDEVDGAAGLDLLERTNDIKVIFSDLSMPVLDGFDFLEKVYENPVSRNIPVMVITSSNDPEKRDRAFALGARWYMVKPVEPDDIVRAVREVFDPSIPAPQTP
jgi:signal transduction histidine kinase